jgi:hypothetical protein
MGITYFPIFMVVPRLFFGLVSGTYCLFLELVFYDLVSGTYCLFLELVPYGFFFFLKKQAWSLNGDKWGLCCPFKMTLENLPDRPLVIVGFKRTEHIHHSLSFPI